MADYHDWFGRARERLERRGQWLDGGEPGRQPPAAFTTAHVRLLICRLSPYPDTRPSITHRLLYWAARQVPGVYADLAWFPTAHDAAVLDADRIPWWLATGSKQMPAAFDLLAVSLSVPQEAVNLPVTLQRSGIALDSRTRLDDPAAPLILLGGNAAGGTPFLHGNAAGPGSGGLADAVCFGDGLLWLQDCLRAWREAGPAARTDKRGFLRHLAARLPGTWLPWAPGQPSSSVQRRVEPMTAWASGYDGGFIPFDDEEAEETLPLVLGCPHRCHFCQTGWERGELTGTPPALLAAAAQRLKAATAATDLNLLAPDAASLPGLREALTAARRAFPKVSVKSLAVASLARAGAAATFPELADKREFSLGVEGISTRLRAWLGKRAEPAAITAALRPLAAAGLRQVKLFFIATGRENTADLAEFADLLGQVRNAAPGARRVASFTPLFHAPFTPLQFAAVRPPDRHVMEQLAALAAAQGCEFRWSASPEEITALNRLCRAGRQATPAVVAVSLEDGIRYGSALPAKTGALLERRWRQAGLAPAALDAALPATAPLPWDVLDAGTPRATLWRHFEQAEAGLAGTPSTDSPALNQPTAGLGTAPAGHRRPVPAHHTFPAATGAPVTATPLPDETTWSWWIELPPAAAWQPAATVARGWLRERFLTDPTLAAAYRGGVRLTPGTGTAGLARLSAMFQGGIPATAGADTATPAAANAEFWWWLTWGPQPGGSVLTAWEAEWRTRGVKAQRRRRPDAVWLVTGATFRTKTGVAVAGEWNDGSGGAALCSGDVRQRLGDAAVRLLPAPVLTVAAGRWTESCPACGARRWEPVRVTTTAPATLPPCPACLLR